MNAFYTINLSYPCIDAHLNSNYLTECYNYYIYILHIRHKYNIERREGFKCASHSINYLSLLPLAMSKIPKVLTRGRLMLTVERLISEVLTHSLQREREIQ